MKTSGVITAVHRDSKRKQVYLIDLDNEFAFEVHEEVFIKYHLMKGTEVDSNFFAEVLRGDQENRAYLAAINYLSYRPRSSREVERYLMDKEFSLELAERIVEKCTREGYVNDELFAKKWVEERLRLKPRGAYMLKMELKQKGIAPSLIEKVLGRIEYEQELDAARSLLRGKLARKTAPIDQKTEHKLLQFLLRKGFSHSIVQQVRNEWRTKNWTEEEDEQ
ncbi:RecX family transcriptional regulator [Brevibacillus laterosporus]|uniref:RecX family transcriptional regulator n=1 Tax=Brevibacillus laterosporus TaxID=1465 RepID=UPI00112C273F|nr:RecX family transcriptional regulator [Brevibacillus laterosporus]MBG9803751.1 RecX family transcriptional regulator [Brevibacillus laterosporus]MED4765586.1 RecX family transcriptional regulator [Brevibacillus laterosporus]TPH21875.1 RecX family transcriptional regulator [Brevibacillus laterosporus]